jgi:arginyl-tRNA synthetase
MNPETFLQMDIIELLSGNMKKAVKSVEDLNLETVSLERPENAGFGDYSTNVAMVIENQRRRIQLAKACRRGIKL